MGSTLINKSSNDKNILTSDKYRFLTICRDPFYILSRIFIIKYLTIFWEFRADTNI